MIDFEKQGLQQSPCLFDEGNDLSIQLLPAISSIDILLNSSPIQYGDKINFVIPGTSLVLSYSNTSNMVIWSDKRHTFGEYPPTIFKIIPGDDKNKLGDVIKYGDKFSINYQEIDTIYLDDKYLYKTYSDYKDAAPYYKMAFTFKSRMNGYYCNGKKCKMIPIDMVQKHGKAGRYKGHMVTRNKGCLGTCNYKSEYDLQSNLLGDTCNKPTTLMIVGFVITILILLGAIIFTIKLR